MRVNFIWFVAAFVLGGLCVAGSLAAGQYLEGLNIPITYTIRDAHGRPLIGNYTITVTRVGSRYLSADQRVTAQGRSDNQGYVRTRVIVPCQPSLMAVLKPLLK